MTTKVILTILLLAGRFSTASLCSAQQSRVYTFPINNANRKEFGYECPKHGGPGIGPCSLAIHDGMAFIVDNYHDNVKKICLSTGRILATTLPSGGEHKRWFCDVVVTDDHVLVSTDLDYLYVFDMSLRQIDSLQIPRGTQYFDWKSDTLLLLDTPMRLQDQHSYTVSVVNGKVTLKKCDTAIHTTSFFVTTAHGKAYSVNRERDSWVLRKDHSNIVISRRIPRIGCYDAINLDFDRRHVVFFDVSGKRMGLYVVDCP